MESCTNVIEDECAEISVNTEEVEPRGTFAEKERNLMTSFETLVHTALALEDDPRNEHSYAYSDKKMTQESMDKDHCYYSGSKLDSHRKIQSLSDENLYAPAKSDVFDDKYFVLPHYRSNDSALDVTGFDTISDKCLSFENIHVKTVDVFTESCILPGVSDPDLSRMTIQGQADANTSFSLPNSPPSSGISVDDHSYSYSSYDLSEQNRMTLLKDHTYDNLCKTSGKDNSSTNDNLCKTGGKDKSQFLRDHSYGNRKRRDSLPASVGIKRGRSNDDLSLLGCYSFKRKDFTKSPFLDHTYQSVELQNVHTNTQSSKRNKTGIKISKSISVPKSENEKTKNDVKVDDTSQKIYSFKQKLFPNRLLLDHTYEEVTDSTADLPLTDFISQASGLAVSGLARIFGEIKTDKSDHSYVIKKQFDDANSTGSSSSELSDSGTESLNEEEEEEISASFHERVNPVMSKRHTEHPYFKSKTWRTKKKT